MAKKPVKIKEIRNVPSVDVHEIRQSYEDENADAGRSKYEVWAYRVGPDNYTIEIWENPAP